MAVIKVAAPKLPPQLEPASIAMMIDDGQLEDMQLIDADGGDCNLSALDLSGVLFERMQFTGAHFSRITCRDVVSKQVDWSSASMDSGSLVRLEFIGCRMTGVDFNQASLHDVVFRGCKLDLANFRQADLRRVQFIDCTLVEADFSSATLSSIDFQSSVLEQVAFGRATCKAVDLRTSQLSDISGWASLKGATIDGLQLAQSAPYLARELGLVVRD